MRTSALTAVLLTTLHGSVLAQMPRPVAGALEAVATRTSQAPTIDGRLDDAAWTAGEPISGFVQREPFEGQPVSERTEVRVLYDDQALYVGAWLYDRDPDAIVLGTTL